MKSNSRASFLYALRRFFIDYELWGWGRLQFSPYRHLATPNTPTFSRGVNPRVIDDPVWLRLIWASLNLRPEDMLTGIHYPFAMHQAMAVIWTHAGLRQNEILRLTTGCVQAQGEDIVGRRQPHSRRYPVLPERPRRQNIKSLCQTGGGCGEKVCRLMAAGAPG